MLPPDWLGELRDRTSLVDVIGQFVPLRRNGREHLGCCPFHGEKTPSFTVVEQKGFAHCFGCSWSGDIIKFVMDYDGRDFMAAIGYLADLAGMVVPGSDGAAARALAPMVKRASPEAIDTGREHDIKWSRELFRGGLPWRGTAVEHYLSGRRCCPADDIPSIRYVPSLKYRDRWADGQPCNGAWDAMVAAIQGRDGRIGGVHRTYLAEGGQGKAPVPKAKKMRGDAWGGTIRLAAAGRMMAISEGIETGLSVRLAVADLPVWVAGSLGNIAGRGEREAVRVPHPTREGKWVPTVLPDLEAPGIVLPDGVEELIILADADGDRPTGCALVERAARRFADARHGGLRVRVAWPPAGMDFNDILMQAEAA